jgi:hypothetical protein
MVIEHDRQSDLSITKRVPVVSASKYTFSYNRQYVAVRGEQSYQVRQFSLYTRSLFETHRTDTDIERYLSYFQLICESEYGTGDPFCRCANYDGGLTAEYALGDNTYASKRLAQTAQCLDQDCIYRKSLPNNVISVHKLNATNCDMDLTVCSTAFDGKDVSASSQVNVINQCGGGSGVGGGVADTAMPMPVNNGSGFWWWGLILSLLVGTILALVAIQVYRYNHRAPV